MSNRFAGTYPKQAALPLLILPLLLAANLSGPRMSPTSSPGHATNDGHPSKLGHMATWLDDVAY